METVVGVFTILGGLLGSFITYVVFKLERKEKFRIVAIEKRLDAHQQALNHWDNLRSVIHENNDNKRSVAINNARNFWFLNCIYMEKRTRNLFFEIISTVSDYPMYLQMWKHEENPIKKKEANKELLKQ